MKMRVSGELHSMILRVIETMEGSGAKYNDRYDIKPGLSRSKELGAG